MVARSDNQPAPLGVRQLRHPPSDVDLNGAGRQMAPSL
jgi:hypothetical protein